ncbi:hypothetical protein CEUSTIGMA_g6888.t1 [Chlamydomonas eustigma]|uniref:Carbohydrate kinase PfkB domain-containing protein n=1 Tax=Chlamydomonas eustigma TaxID=1157962 RepID=A0A250X8R3_9CHLO|nr:hypothetical protein CEUSTIGMA_g6888.t1 [Chlamydomonas eustigma]|eukprot:GAX79447.1 hypothetical protein CEUSTIGMA_g6888.t1 [Chlamydomonas eustigma]
MSSIKDSYSRRLRVFASHILSRSLVSEQNQGTTGSIIILGAAVLDIQAVPERYELQRGSSVPGKVRQIPGGVGRNIAECLSCMIKSPAPAPVLATFLGDDAAGQALLSHLRSLRLNLSLTLIKHGMPSPCVAVAFDKSGEVAACVADVASIEQHFTPEAVIQLLSSHELKIQAPSSSSVKVATKDLPPTPSIGADSIVPGAIAPLPSSAPPPLLVVEANLTAESVLAACRWAHARHVPIFMEPVSVPKAVRCVLSLHLITYIKPNAGELISIADAIREQQGLPALPRPQLSDPDHEPAPSSSGRPEHSEKGQAIMPSDHSIKMHKDAGLGIPSDIQQLVPFAGILLSTGLRYIVLTLGGQGAALMMMSQQDDRYHAAAVREDNALMSGNRTEGATVQLLHPQQDDRYHAAAVREDNALMSGNRTEGATVQLLHPQQMVVMYMKALPAKVVSLSGAGDALVGGMTAALSMHYSAHEALAHGMAAAKMAVQSEENVPRNMDFDSLAEDANAALKTMKIESFLLS